VALKLGVSLPQGGGFNPGSDLLRAARGLEDIGFDSVWVFERVLFPEDQSGSHGAYGVPGLEWPEAYRNVPDALVTLSLAAAVTHRVQLGTSVLIPPLHLPLRLARALATLDAASGGRVIAGLGTSWSVDEFAATAPRPFGQLGDALDEFLDIARAAWGPDPVEFSSERYVIDRAVVRPKPHGEIPVYLAAGNSRSYDRVARRADGWMPVGVAPDAVGSTLRMLRDQAAGYGRRPEDVRCIFQMGTAGNFDEVPSAGRQPYTGSVPQLVEDFAALAEAGVEHVFATVPYAVRDCDELLDVSADLYAQVRAAGL
jgi:probable F420-dependent oxidoreductase